MLNNNNNLKKNTVYSTLSLFFQSGYTAFLGLTANVILTILLSPKIFGIYITVLSIIALLNYFSDIGLAASLVQKKDISDDDVKTTFTIQQILVISLVVFGFFTTNFIKQFYGLPIDGVYLYWALLFGFFLSSLKTIPSIFIERKIQFQKIVMVQIVENTVFYLTVIILGLFGFSLFSFTMAVIFRSVIGVVIIYSISFWIPTIGISKKSLKNLLSFGAPFQASSLLALFKDELITLYLGKVIGFEGLGYIGWAKKWAEAPIRIIMDNISRVLFPVFSRIQNDMKKTSGLIEKILYYQTLLLAPIMAGMAILITDIVWLIPKYYKWAPAIPLFFMLSFAAFLSSYSSPFINFFNAIGKVKITLFFMIFWTSFTWLLTPIFSLYFDYYGFPITQIILACAFVLVLYQAKKYAKFSFITPIYKPIISTLIMTLILLIVKNVLPQSIFSLGILSALGVIIYYLILRLLFKIDIINEFKNLFHYE